MASYDDEKYASIIEYDVCNNHKIVIDEKIVRKICVPDIYILNRGSNTFFVDKQNRFFRYVISSRRNGTEYLLIPVEEISLFGANMKLIYNNHNVTDLKSFDDTSCTSKSFNTYVDPLIDQYVKKYLNHKNRYRYGMNKIVLLNFHIENDYIFLTFYIIKHDSIEMKRTYIKQVYCICYFVDCDMNLNNYEKYNLMIHDIRMNIDFVDFADALNNDHIFDNYEID